MKTINIGLIGFGTVGSGVYHLLEKNAAIIQERTGFLVKITAICDLRKDALTKIIPGIRLTDKWQEVVNDKDIEIIVELIGGIEPARSIILEAIKSNKNVVTANKKLLAEAGMEIFERANSTGIHLGYEASVAGGIPCIQALKHGLVGNRIKSVIGILNGTTNYILTKMSESAAPFGEVLKVAQDKGFAEADPTFDIEGFDAGHKIALLSMLAYNKKVDYSKIFIEGITKIKEIDISFAKDMGYIIKLLGICKEVDGKLDIRVHPAMLQMRHPLASVKDEYNAVMFDGDMTGPIILHGKGAGSHPTASAVMGDIVHIAKMNGIKEKAILLKGDAEYVDNGNRIARYYLRLYTKDQPGILAQVAGVLGSNNISIASVLQKELNDEFIPLIIMTHESTESNMLNALEDIKKFNFINDDTMLIRVED